MSLSKNFIYQLAILVIVAVVLEGANGKPPRRVVGGINAEIGEFSFQASVRKYGMHICGGSIIGKRHILTAAHCIVGQSDNPAKQMTIVVGTNAFPPRAGVSHAIKSATVHPGYKGNYEDSWKNDIAIIALTKDIVFNVFAGPIKLPKVDTPARAKCVARGWGIPTYPSAITPNNMKMIGMTTVSNDECFKKHKINIWKTHICAYANVGVGICLAESGGPLVHDKEVVGIASLVFPCGKGVPDVFTRVYSYLDFIKKVMEST